MSWSGVFSVCTAQHVAVRVWVEQRRWSLDRLAKQSFFARAKQIIFAARTSQGVAEVSGTCGCYLHSLGLIGCFV